MVNYANDSTQTSNHQWTFSRVHLYTGAFSGVLQTPAWGFKPLLLIRPLLYLSLILLRTQASFSSANLPHDMSSFHYDFFELNPCLFIKNHINSGCNTTLTQKSSTAGVCTCTYDVRPYEMQLRASQAQVSFVTVIRKLEKPPYYKNGIHERSVVEGRSSAEGARPLVFSVLQEWNSRETSCRREKI